ncbi:hypothetical protein LLG95_13605 [bacterium]|nr:hypothetical protein [bacterium]
MGVLELIQQKSFLGREFLTWLWYRSEQGGQIELHGGKPVTVEIMGPILLDAQYGDARASTLKGESPATSPEAGTALIEGKKLRRARLKMERDGVEWVLTLDGETFNISGLAIPNPGRMPFEDTLTMRAEMIFEFERTLDTLFQEFMHLRLEAKQWPKEIKKIHEWVKEK